MLGSLDDYQKRCLASVWLYPQDVISLYRSSAAWHCIAFLLPGMRFAVSRCQRSGSEFSRSAIWWNELWLDCKKAVRQQGWPISVWRFSCCCSRLGHPCIATESVFCALDVLLAAAGHADASSLAILAVDINERTEEDEPTFILGVHCVVVLSSGCVAFVGTLKGPNDNVDARLAEIFFNVAVANTMTKAVEAATELILRHSLFSIAAQFTELRPWANDKGTLRISFCDQDFRTGHFVIIPDPFVVNEDTMFLTMVTALEQEGSAERWDDDL